MEILVLVSKFIIFSLFFTIGWTIPYAASIVTDFGTGLIVALGYVGVYIGLLEILSLIRRKYE